MKHLTINKLLTNNYLQTSIRTKPSDAKTI